MMEIKIAPRTCPDELGRSRTFHYSLTVDTVESGAFSCENYGVKSPKMTGTPLPSLESPPALFGSTS